MPYAVKGGIGDFLQCLPFMLNHKDEEYYVVTHQRGATEFFKKLGLTVKEFSFGQLPDAELCPRQMFFDKNPFKTLWPRFTSKKPIIGVHLGGSEYSLSIEARFGFPPKALPKALLEGISASTGYDFIVFGAPKELEAIGKGNWQLVDEYTLDNSLSRVTDCDAFIGSDSAFKTMSAMLKIPTIVLMGDYRDDHRDERFINPYKKEGIVSVFRYWNLDREMDDAIDFCLKKLDEKCLNFQMSL